MESIILILFFIILAAVAWTDSRTMEIPNRFPAAILVLAVLSAVIQAGTADGNSLRISSRILGLFSVSLPMLLLTIAVPGAFGGGDRKLMAACGFFLGWKLTVLAALFAVLGGGLYGIWLLTAKKAGRKEHFAFGPFLCAGIVIAYFWGEAVLEWYWKVLLGL